MTLSPPQVSTDVQGLAAAIRCISHDLRTPIAAVQSYAELLQDEISGSLNEDQLEEVGTVLRQTRQLTRMTMNLSMLAQLDSGKFGVMPVPATLGGLMEPVRAESAAAFERKSVGLRFGEIPRALALVVDRPRMQHLLSNLLETVLILGTPGSQVTFDVEVMDEALEIAVDQSYRFTGAEDSQNIFTRFYQVETRKYGDSATTIGVNLEVVRAVAEAHEGHVAAEDHEGGTRFRIRIPRGTTQGDSQ